MSCVKARAGTQWDLFPWAHFSIIIWWHGSQASLGGAYFHQLARLLGAKVLGLHQPGL